jgi:hypothetical protein
MNPIAAATSLSVKRLELTSRSLVGQGEQSLTIELNNHRKK